MKKISLPFGKKNKLNVKSEDSYIINKDTKFSTIEAYKVARTNIQFSLPKSEGAKKILVSSAEPGEGKSTTTVNLAITFAQTGAKVLLIDCDLRKPRIHRYLKLKKGKGISNVLCGFAKLEDVILKNVSPVEGELDCILAGEIPPNPAELLSSEEMAKVMEELSPKYDYIFIDTPPVLAVTDAMVVATYATGVVCVVKQNTSSYDGYDAAMGILKRAGVKILGFVFNYDEKANTDKKKYYGGKYKYASSYRYAYKYVDNYKDSNQE